MQLLYSSHVPPVRCDLIDVMFLVDGSESICSSRFDAVTAFLEVASDLLYERSPDAGIAIAEFSTTYTLATTYFANLSSVVRSLPQSKGVTNTGTAIFQAVRTFLSDTRSKDFPPFGVFEATKVLVVLTDGEPSTDDETSLRSAIDLLGPAGVTVIAIGLGSDVNQASLTAMAQGNTDNVFPEVPFMELNSLVTTLVDSMENLCPQPTVRRKVCGTTTASTSQSTTPSTSPTTTAEPTTVLPVTVNPSVSCVDGRNNCDQCNDENTACEICKNQAGLLLGTCFENCPAGFVKLGTGNFRRRCMFVQTTQPVSTTQTPCVDGRNNCNSCADGVCEICKNGAGLFNGVCLDECPDGTFKAGSGNFRRTCDPIVTTTPAQNTTIADTTTADVTTANDNETFTVELTTTTRTAGQDNATTISTTPVTSQSTSQSTTQSTTPTSSASTTPQTTISTSPSTSQSTSATTTPVPNGKRTGSVYRSCAM